MTGRAIEWVGGENAAITGIDNDIVIGDDVALLLGDDKNNWLIHRGAGEAYGGKGDDVLIGWLPEVLKQGQAVDRAAREGGATLGDVPVLSEDHQLKLDGEAGSDWIVVLGGEKATAIGGTGRDWVFNTSKGGESYGDTVDGADPETGQAVADSSENSDNFWYFPDTTIMDAQHYDVLKFFGLPMTGGDAAAPATRSREVSRSISPVRRAEVSRL